MIYRKPDNTKMVENDPIIRASSTVGQKIGAALSAIHDRVNTPWTVESLAEEAGMSRSADGERWRLLLLPESWRSGDT
jgi:transcriptional regulator GlxA family with amidase domain